MTSVPRRLSPSTVVPGLDDLAPAGGLGAPTPEPSTCVLTVVGALGMIAHTRR
jgi:hypothetical protein